jgi:hypothetical protein
MTKALLAAVVIGSSCSFGGLAFAQGKQGDAFGTDVSSQCAQMANPGAKADCIRLLRKDADLGSERSWQGGSSASHSSQGVGSSAGGARVGTGAGMGAGKSRR